MEFQLSHLYLCDPSCGGSVQRGEKRSLDEWISNYFSLYMLLLLCGCNVLYYAKIIIFNVKGTIWKLWGTEVSNCKAFIVEC